MAGRAANSGANPYVRDLQTDPKNLVNVAALAKEGFVTFYATPLLAQGKVKGVIEVFHRLLLNPGKR